MNTNTAIEWTEATWNPVTGCSKVSPGCKFCYAETVALRFWATQYPRIPVLPAYNWDADAGGPPTRPREFTDVRCHEDRLDQPLRWRRPRRIFVNSMSDLFHEDVPFEFIDRVFAVMALAPQHTFQILTKRAARMREYMTTPVTTGRTRESRVNGEIWTRLGTRVGSRIEHGGDWRCRWPLPNCWLGVSVENQQYADERIPILLGTPAAVRFLSCEPLLGPIDLSEIRVGGCGEEWDPYLTCDALARPRIFGPHLDWVIVGGESGTGARPMHQDWARSIRDQCVSAGVPYFFKQWGEWTPGENVERQTGTVQTAHWFDNRWIFSHENLARTDRHIDDEPDLYRVGKKAAGRLLDGREWNEPPAS